MLCYFCADISNKQNLYVVAVNVKGVIMIIIILLIILRRCVPQSSHLHFLKLISIKRHALGIEYASVKRVDTTLLKQLKHFFLIKTRALVLYNTIIKLELETKISRGR